MTVMDKYSNPLLDKHVTLTLCVSNTVLSFLHRPLLIEHATLPCSTAFLSDYLTLIKKNWKRRRKHLYVSKMSTRCPTVVRFKVCCKSPTRCRKPAPLPALFAHVGPGTVGEPHNGRRHVGPAAAVVTLLHGYRRNFHTCACLCAHSAGHTCVRSEHEGIACVWNHRCDLCHTVGENNFKHSSKSFETMAVYPVMERYV